MPFSTDNMRRNLFYTFVYLNVQAFEDLAFALLFSSAPESLKCANAVEQIPVLMFSPSFLSDRGMC